MNILIFIIMIFFGLIYKLNGWEDQFSKGLEFICIYGGLLGFLIFSIIAIYNFLEERRFYKLYNKDEHLNPFEHTNNHK